ncbi:phosphoribosyltransferase [Halorientalis salina]|uniref:phosphoribosyltransferase n=1 Tax=Halorientalis salina TaxID=2932266 RepID=UPI0010AD5806|nr:phosphoribosyltransferase family protein [Halorientalis salina]
MHRGSPTTQFADREEAGQRLGERLRQENVDGDIVLAIPRGGLPLGRAVADAIDAPLDIVVAKKIGAPGNPEFAIGAVAADGSVWLNERVIERQGIGRDYVADAREQKAREARQKAERYRDGPPPELAGKRVVIVDDGVATGATVRACIEQVRAEQPARIVLAVPVGSPRTMEELEEMVDAVVALETPADFRAVGQFYQDFAQVTDEEAMAYLD